MSIKPIPKARASPSNDATAAVATRAELCLDSSGAVLGCTVVFRATDVAFSNVPGWMVVACGCSVVPGGTVLFAAATATLTKKILLSVFELIRSLKISITTATESVKLLYYFGGMRSSDKSVTTQYETV